MRSLTKDDREDREQNSEQHEPSDDGRSMASKPAPYTDVTSMPRVVADSGVAPLIRCCRWRRTQDSLQMPSFGAIDKRGEFTRGYVGVMLAILPGGHWYLGHGSSERVYDPHSRGHCLRDSGEAGNRGTHGAGSGVLRERTSLAESTTRMKPCPPRGRVLTVSPDTDAGKTTRSCRKLIRFTPAELSRVNERARAVGQPVACYIRDVAVGTRRKASSASLSGPVIHGLARVATRLRALRETAAQRALPEADEFGAAVDDLLALIQHID